MIKQNIYNTVLAQIIQFLRSLEGQVTIATCIFLSFILSPNSLHKFPSICIFYNITLLPCPGCGLTRSFVFFSHGHFQNSFLFHPFGPILYLVFLIFLLEGIVRRRISHFSFFSFISYSNKLIVAFLFIFIWLFWSCIRIGYYMFN